MTKHDEHEPMYVISVAAKLVGAQAQTLRYYEKMGLVSPRRSRGRIRLYSPSDIERIRRIQRLMEDLGVNLAGVEVIIRMSDQITQMEHALREVEAEAEQLRRALSGNSTVDQEDQGLATG